MTEHESTRSSDSLRRVLRQIDGAGYGAYKRIKGEWDFPDFTLVVDYVQGDPYARPSRLRLLMPLTRCDIPNQYYSNPSREIALRDYLTRRFQLTASDYVSRGTGSGRSGTVIIDPPSQEILERTSILIHPEHLEARFLVGLPAQGRRILGSEAERILIQELPPAVVAAFVFENLDEADLSRHVYGSEDQDSLRGQLGDAGLVAFVADGANLPRRSGIDPRPMVGEQVVPFTSPPSLHASFTLPNRGEVRGMGIPNGVTLIVGGGYHGKSTLMEAIQLGVYNHIPSDGRDLVATVPDAVKIRAEDGRCVSHVDISGFISNLPQKSDTTAFSSPDASGSTSQAANIVEALEVGATLLLMDEDTSATNFMIRDHRMQQLVSKDHEPITPFIDRVRQLYSGHGVSTILVVGGSGDFFDVVDTVVMMDEFRPRDVTEEAKAIATEYVSKRSVETADSFGAITPRVVDPQSFALNRHGGDTRVRTHGVKTIQFGDEEIDVSDTEQLTDPSQLTAIGDALLYCRDYLMQGATLSEMMQRLDVIIEREGLDVLSNLPIGDHARFRRFELAAAINRLRTLRIASMNQP
jgi:predicted ABC-class ATPase